MIDLILAVTRRFPGAGRAVTAASCPLRTRQGAHVRCQGAVIPRSALNSPVQAVRQTISTRRLLIWEEGRHMADVAFVALIIGVFGLLLLTIRGLEKL